MNGKETVFGEFCNAVHNSVPYDKMTNREKADCLAALQWAKDSGAVCGKESTRWAILRAVYYAFLCSKGYDPFDCKDVDTWLYDKRYFAK